MSLNSEFITVGALPLSSILNADNKMNVETAESIANGNKAYYANSKLIKIENLKGKH
jgi:hypothetical protein